VQYLQALGPRGALNGSARLEQVGGKADEVPSRHPHPDPDEDRAHAGAAPGEAPGAAMTPGGGVASVTAWSPSEAARATLMTRLRRAAQQCPLVSAADGRSAVPDATGSHRP